MRVYDRGVCELLGVGVLIVSLFLIRWVVRKKDEIDELGKDEPELGEREEEESDDEENHEETGEDKREEI